MYVPAHNALFQCPLVFSHCKKFKYACCARGFYKGVALNLLNYVILHSCCTYAVFLNMFCIITVIIIIVTVIIFIKIIIIVITLIIVVVIIIIVIIVVMQVSQHCKHLISELFGTAILIIFLR